jgi:hypothetical protein
MKKLSTDFIKSFTMLVLMLVLPLSWGIYRNVADEHLARSTVNLPAKDANSMLSRAGASLLHDKPNYYWRMRGGGSVLLVTDHDGKVIRAVFMPVWHLPL